MISKNILSKALPAAVLAAAALGFGPTQAASFDLSFTNIYSVDDKGDADNVTLVVDLGPMSYVTGFSWDVDVTAYSPSWLSELWLGFTNSAGEGVEFSPVSWTNAAGTDSSSGSFDLQNLGLAFYTKADGKLNLEFFESFDDTPDMPDGRWNSGSLSFIYAPIPEPATMALFGAGLFAVLGISRRRLPVSTRHL